MRKENLAKTILHLFNGTLSMKSFMQGGTGQEIEDQKMIDRGHERILNLIALEKEFLG